MSICRTCFRSRAHAREILRLLVPAQRPAPRSISKMPLLIPSRSYTAGANQPVTPEVVLSETPKEAASEPHQSPSRIAKGTEEFTDVPFAIAQTEIIFKECARHGDYYVPQAFQGKEAPKTADGQEIGEGTGWWYETLGLTPTFMTWVQITFLHLYLVNVRLRYLPPEHAKLWRQHLLDRFFLEAEHRMTIFHRMTSASMRQRNLKALYDQWRGFLAAHDEGLIKGDAVLGTAVWRNLFNGDDNVDWSKVALVVSFMRRGLRALDQASDQVLLNAKLKFRNNPSSEAAVVERESQGMKEPFSKEDAEAYTKFRQELRSD